MLQNFLFDLTSFCRLILYRLSFSIDRSGICHKLSADVFMDISPRALTLLSNVTYLSLLSKLVNLAIYIYFECHCIFIYVSSSIPNRINAKYGPIKLVLARDYSWNYKFRVSFSVLFVLNHDLIDSVIIVYFILLVKIIIN